MSHKRNFSFQMKEKILFHIKRKLSILHRILKYFMSKFVFLQKDNFISWKIPNRETIIFSIFEIFLSIFPKKENLFLIFLGKINLFVTWSKFLFEKEIPCWYNVCLTFWLTTICGFCGLKLKKLNFWPRHSVM